MSISSLYLMFFNCDSFDCNISLLNYFLWEKKFVFQTYGSKPMIFTVLCYFFNDYKTSSFSNIYDKKI